MQKCEIKTHAWPQLNQWKRENSLLQSFYKFEDSRINFKWSSGVILGFVNPIGGFPCPTTIFSFNFLKFGLKTKHMVEKGRNKASKNFGLYAEKIASMEPGGQKTVLAAAGIKPYLGGHHNNSVFQMVLEIHSFVWKKDKTWKWWMASSILVPTKSKTKWGEIHCFSVKDKAWKELEAGFSGVTMFFYAGGGDLPQDPKWEANSVKRSKHKIQFGLSMMLFPVSFHFCLVVVVCRNKLGKLSTLIPLMSTKFGHQANKETSWLEHLENTPTYFFWHAQFRDFNWLPVERLHCEKPRL